MNNDYDADVGNIDYCVFSNILSDEIVEDILACFEEYPEEDALTDAVSHIEGDLNPDLGDLDPGLLSEEEHAEYLKELEEFREFQRAYLAAQHAETYKYRSCKRHLVDRFAEGWLTTILEKFAVEANLKWMYNIATVDQIELLNYSQPQDGYKWHRDVELIEEGGRNRCRKLTLIVQLSDEDDYEGCDLHIAGDEVGLGPVAIEDHRKALRKKGTVIVFPSFLLHSISPLIKGNRKSLVAWMTGEPWK